jgi:hypothetical protein
VYFGPPNPRPATGLIVHPNGRVDRALAPGPRTCNPEVPSQCCQARLEAEKDGSMYFNQQARGWVYPRPVKIKPPIETWAFCPFCLIPLPDDEVPARAKQLPYRPAEQPDAPHR